MKYVKVTNISRIMLVFILLISCSSIQNISQNVTRSPSIETPIQNSATQIITIMPTPLPQITVRVNNREILCSTDKDDARKAYNEALGNEEAGKLDEAEVLYRKAIEIDPLYCDAMDNLGKLLRQQGKVDEAINWYKKSLEIFPDNTVAIQNLAAAYLFQGNSDDAIAEYEKLTQIAPDNPEGFYGLGTIYINLEQYEKAIEQLEEAEALYRSAGSPYIVDTQYYLSIAYFIQENCTKAKSYAELVYSYYAEDAGINYILGMCFLSDKTPDIEQAKKYIKKAQELGIEIHPDILEAIGEK